MLPLYTSLYLFLPGKQRLRSMAEVQMSTRLVYVMALVGSEQDAPLSSRAVTVMLAKHWGDAEMRKQLQMASLLHVYHLD